MRVVSIVLVFVVTFCFFNVPFAEADIIAEAEKVIVQAALKYEGIDFEKLQVDIAKARIIEEAEWIINNAPPEVRTSTNAAARFFVANAGKILLPLNLLAFIEQTYLVYDSVRKLFEPVNQPGYINKQGSSSSGDTISLGNISWSNVSFLEQGDYLAISIKNLSMGDRVSSYDNGSVQFGVFYIYKSYYDDSIRVGTPYLYNDYSEGYIYSGLLNNNSFSMVFYRDGDNHIYVEAYDGNNMVSRYKVTGDPFISSYIVGSQSYAVYATNLSSVSYDVEVTYGKRAVNVYDSTGQKYDYKQYVGADDAVELRDSQGNPVAVPNPSNPSDMQNTTYILALPYPVPTTVYQDVVQFVPVPIPDEELPPEEPIEQPPDVGLDLTPLLDKFTNKFPFSLPWDVAYILGVLCAEPVTPSIEYDLGNPFNTRISIDLAWLDDFMVYVRKFEFLGFVVATIYATRKLFGGAQ
jgi:hypothetical protein